MGAIYAELHVAGRVFVLRRCTYGVSQATGPRGRPIEQVRHGGLDGEMDVPRDPFLEHWAAAEYLPLDGHVTFSGGPGEPAIETVSWTAGQCVLYREEFHRGSITDGSYVCFWRIVAAKLVFSAGPPAPFVAPAAREHGTPPVAAVLPFVAGADGVPRLPRISGAPPFTVKGARNGKPGLDRGEFARQLTGQQDGLNRLTVAQFLANRDQYLKQALRTGDGRDPLGDAAQKLARKKAFRDKTAELQNSDETLSIEAARIQAQQWLDTQTALHNPDQVAGGYAHAITGLGDARVNSSIGAQWPKRIKGIDNQIRKHAASMSQQERETTFLDIELPLN